MARPRGALPVAAAICLAIACLPEARAGPLNIACETITGIEYCTECSSVPKRCYQCHYLRAPVWSTTGVITACKGTTSGATCTTASRDPNCLRCDGIFCTLCKPGFYFDRDYRCLNAAGSCAKISGNPNCVACNPDGTCTKCKAATPALKLIPYNAMYINAGFGAPSSTCMTVAAINAQAKAITHANAVIPANCLEVDSEFKCSRCVDGQSLTGGVCRPVATTGSKCSTALRYYQYCAKCDPANNKRCTLCNGARGIVAGECSLPCRLLYGIGCRNCNASKCTARDPAYANGRR